MHFKKKKKRFFLIKFCISELQPLKCITQFAYSMFSHSMFTSSSNYWYFHKVIQTHYHSKSFSLYAVIRLETVASPVELNTCYTLCQIWYVFVQESFAYFCIKCSLIKYKLTKQKNA